MATPASSPPCFWLLATGSMLGCVPLGPQEHPSDAVDSAFWQEPGAPPETRPLASDPLWDPKGISEFALTIPIEDWEGALWDAIVDVDPCDDRPYLDAELQFRNPATGAWEDVGDVGVRYRGHSALQTGDHERVGFKIKVNAQTKGKDLHGAERLNLLGTEGDYSLMREHLALALHAAAGVPAPQVSYALVTVNGEFQGLFPLTEEPDDDVFLDTHLDGRGSLYKAAGYCGGKADFTASEDDLDELAEVYEPKVDTTLDDLAEEIVPLLECADSAGFSLCIEDHVDVEQWLTEIAMDMLLPDVDGMAGSGQNFMLHRPPGGRFIVYPWDKDQALTVYNASSLSIFDLHPTWNADFESRVADGLRRHWRAEYCAEVLALSELLDPTRSFGTRWRELGQHLSPWIAQDPFMDWERWTWIVDDILVVATERHLAAVEEAQACQAP